MMLDDSYEMPRRVVHRPLQPARKETPGEGIYLALWVDWCQRNPREWRQIFDTTGPVRQRAASVAASFMVFMGCNGGRGFTFEAERYAKSGLFGSRERAFLAAWAIENQRHCGINHGLRTSEFMLARRHPIGDQWFEGVLWKHVPDVTQDDNDILESMVRWWSGPTARAMREVAEPRIDAEQSMLWALRKGVL